jgi:AmiR/NasT family two-component response regulator
LLMEKDAVPESEAFQRLRTASQQTGKSMRQVAEAVCAAFDSR